MMLAKAKHDTMQPSGSTRRRSRAQPTLPAGAGVDDDYNTDYDSTPAEEDPLSLVLESEGLSLLSSPGYIDPEKLAAAMATAGTELPEECGLFVWVL